MHTRIFFPRNVCKDESVRKRDISSLGGEPYNKVLWFDCHVYDDHPEPNTYQIVRVNDADPDLPRTGQCIPVSKKWVEQCLELDKKLFELYTASTKLHDQFPRVKKMTVIQVGAKEFKCDDE